MPVFRSRCGALSRMVRLALASGAAAVPACGPAAADVLQVRYSISLIGLPLGTAGMTARLESNSYHVEVDVKLTGIASLISNSRAAATATGAISLGRLAPSTYATISASSREVRTLRMGMRAGSVRAVQISPPLIDDATVNRVPLTPADKRNIIDPMSAVVLPVPSGQAPDGPAVCNRSIPVFDGVARYDIDLRFVGMREVKAKGYHGPVSVCAVRYVPLAGYRRNHKATQFMAQSKKIEVWLAPIANVHVAVPFRISVPTLYGTAVIEAADFHLEPSPRAAVR